MILARKDSAKDNNEKILGPIDFFGPAFFLWRRLYHEKARLVACTVMAGVSAKWTVSPVVIDTLTRMRFHKAISCKRGLFGAVTKRADNSIK
jgi:hypothetical protein